MEREVYYAVTIPKRDLWSRIKNVFKYSPRIISFAFKDGRFMILDSADCEVKGHVTLTPNEVDDAKED